MKAEEAGMFSARVRPITRLIISMHPYQPIEKNEDGTGGGIRLRIGDGGNRMCEFVDVIWGMRTEIEVQL